MASNHFSEIENSDGYLNVAKHHIKALQSITKAVQDEQKETLKDYLTFSFNDILSNFNVFETEQSNSVVNIGEKHETSINGLSDIVDSNSRQIISYAEVTTKASTLDTNFVFLNVNPSSDINDLQNTTFKSSEKDQTRTSNHFGIEIEKKETKEKNALHKVHIFPSDCHNVEAIHKQYYSIETRTQMPYNTNNFEELHLENPASLENSGPTEKQSIEHVEDVTEDTDIEMKDGMEEEQQKSNLTGILDGGDVGCLLSFVPHISGPFIKLNQQGAVSESGGVFHLTVEATDGTVQNVDIGGVVPVGLDQQSANEAESKQETGSEKENASNEPTKANIGRLRGRPKAPQLFKQVKNEQNELGYQCPYCSDVLKTQAAMKVHLRIHTGEKPFSCKFCGKSFTTKGNQKSHEKHAHSTHKPIQCQYCEKTFKEKKVCKVHERVHTGEKPYKCEVCSKAFSQAGVLKEHMLIHTGQKPHLCDLCGQEFRGLSALKTHKLRHLNQRDYSCHQCGREFVSKYDMKRHCMTHAGIKPFLCTYCPKGFTRLNYLKEHINFHMGERPFICLECGAQFAESVSLNRHKRKHKVDLEDQTKNKQDSELAKELTSGPVESSLSEQELLGQTSVQLILDENTTNEDLQRLQSIVLSSNDYSIHNQDPAKQIYQVLCVNPDTQEMSSLQHIEGQNSTDFSAINLLANATTNQYVLQ